MLPQTLINRKKSKSGHNIGTRAYPCYGLILKFFWFIKICGYIVENSGKITPPSRQLFASQLFVLHKQQPIWPLKWSFWRSVFFTKAAVAQLLVVWSKSWTSHHILGLLPLQKLCNKQWATVVHNEVDFGQKRVSSHELFSSRCVYILSFWYFVFNTVHVHCSSLFVE